MRAEILKIEKHVSRLPERGYFYYIFLKLADGKSAKTCVYEKFRNYRNWQNVIARGIGTKLDDIVLIGKNLVTADSQPKIVDA